MPPVVILRGSLKISFSFDFIRIPPSIRGVLVDYILIFVVLLVCRMWRFLCRQPGYLKFDALKSSDE